MSATAGTRMTAIATNIPVTKTEKGLNVQPTGIVRDSVRRANDAARDA